ncbi:MAG: primosomal protein DnaI [Alkalibacterium sp.]|uniref:Primosomal protein DnaI n=1 Tax=Alkalibacterium gilvum TaxID=1130080 RepID=A0A1H6TQI0_9LACT|nr:MULTISPECIES: primosomal protein DnaI [Alkalibacterium]MDN6293622.1 primosomal protein DnaI [Alkalibacterium sp.]MDN6294930.1 primosomal protein DnaI [Alkalibacterium sp.]MDN6327598.1 primosomal protein DnaI [Alkalibacterium sp.]MDN6385425.1 primosomal protein DnaI [Alkalibacterium sp.]MDN6397486.1 primosomal protein DnaI [Alkalibacterium sp.]
MESLKSQLEKMMDANKLNQTYRDIMKNQVFSDPEVKKFLSINKETLDKNAIERSASKLYEFVSEKQKAENMSGELAPGYTPKLILNNHRIDVTYEPTSELINKKAEEKIKNRIQSVFMPKDLKNASFESFEVTRKRQAALEKAIMFVENYLDSPKAFHKGLYLYGAFGVGKTYLLGAIAHELSEQGYPSTIVHFPTFAVEMKNSIGKNTTEDKLDSFKQASLLMLDDIGADSMSSWIRDDILGVILQYRMQQELPTFFTSNFDMEQLENEHLTYSQRGENEPLKAKRIMERIKFLTEEVEMSGENRRHK